MTEITVTSPFDDEALKVDHVHWGDTMGSRAGSQIQITYGYGREQKIIALSVKDARTLAERILAITKA